MLVYVLGADRVILNEFFRGRWEKIFESTVVERRGKSFADHASPSGYPGSAKFGPFSLTVFSRMDSPVI
jgi:hypothetical protein